MEFYPTYVRDTTTNSKKGYCGLSSFFKTMDRYFSPVEDLLDKVLGYPKLKDKFSGDEFSKGSCTDMVEDTRTGCGPRHCDRDTVVTESMGWRRRRKDRSDKTRRPDPSHSERDRVAVVMGERKGSSIVRPTPLFSLRDRMGSPFMVRTTLHGYSPTKTRSTTGVTSLLLSFT